MMMIGRRKSYKTKYSLENKEQRKERLNKYSNEYYHKNKSKFKKYKDELLKKNPEFYKNYYKNWYDKNRKKKIIYQINYLQINNYITEKTPYQKKIRCIKRKTRLLFPIINQKCDFCLNNATEHHHYTNPIEVDKFNYVCHECHKIKNKERVIYIAQK